MSAEWARVVAKNPILIKEFGRVVAGIGFKYRRRTGGSRYVDSFRRYMYEGPGGVITLVKNEPLMLDYAVLEISDAEKAEDLLRKKLPCYKLDEVVDKLRSPSREDREQGFRILAEMKYVEFSPELLICCRPLSAEESAIAWRLCLRGASCRGANFARLRNGRWRIMPRVSKAT